MRPRRFEVLKSRVNLKILQEQLKHEIIGLPPCDRVGYRGWSLLSSNGDYKDGWHTGSSLYASPEQFDENPQLRSELSSAMVSKPGEEYIHPTPLLKGYFKTVVRFLSELGFQPHRAQIALLKAGESLAWHRDSLEGEYCVRLHIPILTNENCFFEYPDERIHLKADGSIYLLDGSCLHRFVNQGLEDRYHFISYVRDTQGLSEYFKYKSQSESITP